MTPAMTERLEIRWKIEAYSPDTMPLNRLLEYMGELASMLAPFHSELHLIRVDDGSTVPVLYTDADHVAGIHERSVKIRGGTAPPRALDSYRKINRMLRNDGATAALYEVEGERVAEIIPFPGVEEGPPLIKKLRQQGSVDGRLERIGGVRQNVPMTLRKPDGTKITGLYADRELAKRLSQHWDEPVRLFGTGLWTLSEEGHWIMESFSAENFKTLDDAPLSEVVRQLRTVEADWPEDPIAEILDEAAE